MVLDRIATARSFCDAHHVSITIDYGWGPVANRPGSLSLIPGVAETSNNTEISTYPLVGRGPLGLTAVTETL